MSRELKFRAWVPEDKYMAYQGTPDLETISSFMYHFGDEKLMQFTGLHDKNGKEIYDGDVVICHSYPYHDEHNPIWIGNVFYLKEDVSWHINWRLIKEKSRGGLQTRRLSNQFYYLEVIGNIYENPELLELKL